MTESLIWLAGCAMIYLGLEVAYRFGLSRGRSDSLTEEHKLGVELIGMVDASHQTRKCIGEFGEIQNSGTLRGNGDREVELTISNHPHHKDTSA